MYTKVSAVCSKNTLVGFYQRIFNRSTNFPVCRISIFSANLCDIFTLFNSVRWVTLNIKLCLPGCIKQLETRMHSLEANASPAGRFFTVKCRRRSRLPYFGASQDIVGDRISQNIHVATPNLVSHSVPFVLPNFVDTC